MSRSKKKYDCGQSRGGGVHDRKTSQKDYHRVMVQFHGSESAYQLWAQKKKGY